MSRQRRKSSGRRSIPAEQQTKSSARYGKTIFNHGLVFLLGGVLVAAVFIASPDLITGKAESASIRTGGIDEAAASPIATADDAEPDTLAELLALDVDQLERVNIARVNLLCAEGLPGAENLDVDQCLGTLDQWAAKAKFDIDRHLYKYREHPEEYEHSEGYFRMLMLTAVVKQDFGVKYNPDRIRDIDFTRSKDLFIHGMIDDDNGGTCVSMPVLITAVARRLGYPVKLVAAKPHIFCRWDDGKGERFNIEVSNPGGMSKLSDDYYKTWPQPISDRELKAGQYLQSLTPAEELAEFLAARGHCLQDNGRLAEAQVAYAHAHALNPKSWLLYGFLAEAVGKERGSGMAASAQPTRRFQPPRDPEAALREVEAINAYNRRLMEQMMRPPQPPQPAWPGQPGSGAEPGAPPNY